MGTGIVIFIDVYRNAYGYRYRYRYGNHSIVLFTVKSMVAIIGPNAYGSRRIDSLGKAVGGGHVSIFIVIVIDIVIDIGIVIDIVIVFT